MWRHIDNQVLIGEIIAALGNICFWKRGYFVNNASEAGSLKLIGKWKFYPHCTGRHITRIIIVTGVTSRDTHAASPASLSWLRDSGAWHEASIWQPRASAKAWPLLSGPEEREDGEIPTLGEDLGIADSFNSAIPSWCINKTFRLSKNWVELWVGISVHKTRIWIFGKQF